ncbi:EAL domain-containing protein [Planctobacterium marinum]|uniref:Signal transduction protein n=1 Tax=Planctobacterium marinum TaxID=1631968 RepID=A0AA48HSE0_9ALTE|nr:signal transduction protein [Planctobacterium marinum]
MWCADCEAIQRYFFDDTRFFFFVPTLETKAKLEKLFTSLDFDHQILDSHCITAICDHSRVEMLLMGVFGEFNGPEQSNTKITTTPGTMQLDYDAIGRLISADVFINRYKSIWIVDSVEQNRYESWFQPIIYAADALKDNPRIFAHEALFRIRDADDTIIPPGYVFSVADKSDLLFSLDLTARRSAIEHAAVANLNSKVFVNFDPSSIYDPSYCLRSTAAAIAKAGLKASDVVFEVTETHKVRNMAHLKGVLNFYRNAGFRVALDDVGAGWSGLNLLNELMPDFAKIDMELIRDIDTLPSKQKIVKHLIAGAKENGIKIIAEGIETLEEARCLAEFGPDYLQGYLYGRPELKGSLNK